MFTGRHFGGYFAHMTRPLKTSLPPTLSDMNEVFLRAGVEDQAMRAAFSERSLETEEMLFTDVGKTNRATAYYAIEKSKTMNIAESLQVSASFDSSLVLATQ